MAFTIISERNLEDGIYKVSVGLQRISPALQEKIQALGLPLLDLGGSFSGLVTPKTSNRLRLRVARGINGPGIDAQLRPIVTAGVVTSLVITNQGTGYTSATPTVLVISGTGTGFTAQLTVVDGRVTAADVLTGGTGYAADTVQVDFELPTRLRRVPTDLPVSEIFSIADYVDAELRAILWQDVITTRLNDMLTALQNTDATVADTTLITG